jgi:hypothetical protein
VVTLVPAANRAAISYKRNSKRRAMSEEDLLRDVVYDAIADARHPLRVDFNNKLTTDESTVFYVSLMLTVDPRTHDMLRVTAKKKERTVSSLVRLYIKDCFDECINDEERDAELNVADHRPDCNRHSIIR